MPVSQAMLQGWRQKPYFYFKFPIYLFFKKERQSVDQSPRQMWLCCLPLFTNSTVYTKAKGNLSFKQFLLKILQEDVSRLFFPWKGGFLTGEQTVMCLQLSTALLVLVSCAAGWGALCLAKDSPSLSPRSVPQHM